MLIVPDKGYSKNTPCALSLISTFLLGKYYALIDNYFHLYSLVYTMSIVLVTGFSGTNWNQYAYL